MNEKRITPADAGTTKEEDSGMRRTEDHPRGCGDNPLFFQVKNMTKGSPPRMRGQHEKSNTYLDDPGITPADAGTTLKDCFIYPTPSALSEYFSSFFQAQIELLHNLLELDVSFHI